MSASVTGTPPPESGDWTLNQSTTILDEENLIINGSIILPAPPWDATFSVSNSTVTINGDFKTTGGRWKIEIHDSTIYLNDTKADGFGSQIYLQTNNNWLNVTNSRFLNMTDAYNGWYSLSGATYMDTVEFRGFGFNSTANFDVRFTNNDLDMELENILIHNINGSIYVKGCSAPIVSNFTVHTFPQYEVGQTPFGTVLIFEDWTNAHNAVIDGINITYNDMGFYEYVGRPSTWCGPAGLGLSYGVTTTNLTLNNIQIYGAGVLTPHTPFDTGTQNPDVTLQNSIINNCDNGVTPSGGGYDFFLYNVTISNGYDGLDSRGTNAGILYVTDSTFSNNTQTFSLEQNNTFIVSNSIITFPDDSPIDRVFGYESATIYCTNVTIERPAGIHHDLEYELAGYEGLLANAYQYWNLTDLDIYVESYRTEGSSVNANVTIGEPTFSDEQLSFSVFAPTGTESTTNIYCGARGEPTEVHGTSAYYYNSLTSILTVNATHSSEQEILIDWSPQVSIISRDVFQNVYLALFLLSIVPIIIVCGLLLMAVSGTVDTKLLLVAVVGLIVYLLVMFVSLPIFYSMESIF